MTQNVTVPPSAAAATAARAKCPGHVARILAPIISALAFLWLPPAALAQNGPPVPAAVADFDNLDTSGESGDRSAAHADRVQAFAEILRETLAAKEKFEIVPLVCPSSPCSSRRVQPRRLMRIAADSGARLLIYGGIQKMSTLVQFGFVEAVDLKTNRSVFKQAISFRGDTEEAFRHAASYVARYLDDLAFAP
jgi:hypothetical protein